MVDVVPANEGSMWDVVDPRTDKSVRTLYAGADLLGCLVEVLARFRPDPLVTEDLAAMHIAAWLYELNDDTKELFAGAQFESRHGDDLALFAVFERAEDEDTSRRLCDAVVVHLARDDRLVWDEGRPSDGMVERAG